VTLPVAFLCIRKTIDICDGGSSQSGRKAAMAFCGKCGSAVNEGVAFCPNCGAAVGAAAPPPPYTPPPPQYQPYPATPGTSGLQENVAGLLCYVLGWLTGIIFLLIDKRPFVRFHAAQSIVVFGGLTILRVALGIIFAGSWYYGFGILYTLVFLVFGLVWLAAWIILMVMAFQGKEFEVPVAAGLARSIAGSVK
jgi:uncharacterized membrane protein